MENKNTEEMNQEDKTELLNQETIVITPVKEEKKKNVKVSTIILIVVSLIIISLIFVGISFIQKPKSKETKKATTTKQTLKNWETAKGEGSKYIFYKSSYSDTVYFVTETQDVHNESSVKLGTYSCNNSSDCKIYSASDNYGVIRDDGKIYAYNIKQNKVKELSFEYNDYTDISVFSYDGILYGFSLKHNELDMYSFYSYEDKKITIKDAYNSIISYGEYSAILKDGYIITYKQENETNYSYYVVEYKTGKVKLTSKAASIGTVSNNGHVYYYKNYCDGDCLEASIYNDKLKQIAPGKRFSQLSVSETGNIAVSNSTTYSIYNPTGTLVKTSKEYKSIGVIMKDYIAVVDNDNYLKLIDYNGDVVAKFIELTDNYIFHYMISGWYTDNGKYGIYLVVENKDIAYGTKGSGLEYYYIPTTKEQGVIETDGVGGYAKPVLYLYPTKNNTKVTVDFEKEYLLTTTYPKYNNSWNVTANKNGDLHDEHGKYYYGLYWEEQGSTNVDFSTGFYVAKDNAINFLEDKLSIIGLNDKERNEFIMYWLPILEKNEKNLVYFELTEERQAFNKLYINPIPDSLLRVAIHVKKVDKKTSIKEEKLTRFNRKGFTVVEWGGVIH